MLPFYRFIRPVRFNYKRSELITLPRGGICLRFEEAQNAKFWFSYSRCHQDDLFNRGVAKQLADARAETVRNNAPLLEAFSIVQPTKNTHALVTDILGFCKNVPLISSISPVHEYLLQDTTFFCEALNEIFEENQKQMQLQYHWLKALDGISKSFYKE